MHAPTKVRWLSQTRMMKHMQEQRLLWPRCGHGIQPPPGCCQGTPGDGTQRLRNCVCASPWSHSLSSLPLLLPFLLVSEIVELLGQQGRPAEAEALVARMEASGVPGSAAVLASLARVMCRCGRWQDAVSLVRHDEGPAFSEKHTAVRSSLSRPSFALPRSCSLGFTALVPFLLCSQLFPFLIPGPSTSLAVHLVMSWDCAVYASCPGCARQRAQSPQQ